MAAKFIVIEGIDGSGKKTQATLLAQNLNQTGKRVSIFHFPRYEKFFGKFIKNYLTGSLDNSQHISPYYRALPFALDRLQAKKELEAAIRSNDFVLCNRYVPSNLAHQSVGITNSTARQKFWSFVETMEYKELGLPKEDIVIFLDISVKNALKLISSRQEGKKNKDLHEISYSHLARARMAYLELSKKYAHWRVINCDNKDTILTPAQIHHQIKAVLFL